MSSGTAPMDKPIVISIPISPDEEVLKVFESTLRAPVLDIVTKSGLKWTTLNLSHRGTNPQRLDQCPPTIVITTVIAEPLQQQGWKTVETKIREEIIKHTKLPIQVEIAQGIPAQYADVGIPYPSVPPIGFSFGVAEEVSNPEKGLSGTLGGYVVLVGHPDTQYALTCNHVGNPRSLIKPADAAAEALTPNMMVCPSNQDHTGTLRAAAARMLSDINSHPFNKEKKDEFKTLMLEVMNEYIPNDLDTVVFPAEGGMQLGKIWQLFQNAVWPPNNDFYTGMSVLPKADLMEAWKKLFSRPNGAIIGEVVPKLRALFDNIWSAEMQNDSSADYREALHSQRIFGPTAYASGLRVLPNPTKDKLCVVDWALVQNTGKTGNNGIPEALRLLAAAIDPNCALAGGKRINNFCSEIKPNDYVFKIGRTTGATAGKISASKATISQEGLIRMGALPADGKLGGHEITSTLEWTIGFGQKIQDGKLVSKVAFSLGGDSGAWVVNGKAELVGIVFSGIGFQQESYIQDIGTILKSVQEVTGTTLTFPN